MACSSTPMRRWAYYRDEGVAQVVVEEKHMGSRALIVVCRDEEHVAAAAERAATARVRR